MGIPRGVEKRVVGFTEKYRKHILKIWSSVGLWMMKKIQTTRDSKKGHKLANPTKVRYVIQIWRKFQFQTKVKWGNKIPHFIMEDKLSR